MSALGPAVASLAVGGAYLLAARGRRWPAWRTLCFWAGLAVAPVAAAMPEQPLASHMAAHSLLVAVAAPLLVLGAPLRLALAALPAPDARRLARALRSRPARAIASPAFAWLAFVSVQLAFHLTPLFELSLTNEPVHALEHALFLGTALLFWELAIGAEPLPGRVRGLAAAAYLMTAMPATDVAGAWFMSTGRQAAGIAMIAGMMPLGLAAAAIAWRAAVDEEARAEREERRRSAERAGGPLPGARVA